MKVFLSYASEHSGIAEDVELALIDSGHEVFLDRSRLRPGRGFDVKIREEVKASDLMIFLVSPESIAPRSYALTELKFAREKWDHPSKGVLPVMVRPTQLSKLPPYLRAVTVMEPVGNIPAEVIAEVAGWRGNAASVAVQTADAGSAANALLWGSAWGYFPAGVVIECLKVSIHRNIDCLGNWKQLQERLDVVERACPPLDIHHESLLRRAKTLSVNVPEHIDPPNVIDVKVPGLGDVGYAAFLDKYRTDLNDAINEYRRVFFDPISEQLDQHSPRLRLAQNLGKLIQGLVLAPIRMAAPGGFDQHGSLLGGWKLKRFVEKHLRTLRKEIREITNTLGLSMSYVEPFEKLATDHRNFLLVTAFQYEFHDRSWEDCDFSMDVLEWPGRLRFRGSLDALALKIEQTEE